MSRFRNLDTFPVDDVEPVPVPFGEWLPDFTELNSPGATEALNVIPMEGGYVPFKDLAPLPGLTIGGAVRGAIAVLVADGTTELYAADNNHFYRKDSLASFAVLDTFAAPISDSYNIQFVPFYDDVVALHLEFAPEVTQVGGGASFSPLGGSPPNAYCGAQVGNFLMLGNLDNEPVDPRKPARIRWSGFDNSATWGSDPITQADFQDMPARGGPVHGIIGREYGTIFQAKMISRATYQGLPNIFAIDTVEDGVGSISGRDIVNAGQRAFFIAEDGFRVWNGTNSEQIGDNKVNRYFFNRLNYGARHRIVGAIDYTNGSVFWAFPTDSTLALNEIIGYSYRENKFFHSLNVYEYLLSSPASFGVTLDDLAGDLDTGYPTSFDDAFYSDGKEGISGFSTSHNFGFFGGAALAAVLETGDFNSPDGRRVFGNKARPLVDLATPQATMQLAGRDQMMGGTLVYDTAVAQEITGECPVIYDARYMRVRVNIPAGATWRHATGIELWRKKTGRT